MYQGENLSASLARLINGNSRVFASAFRVISILTANSRRHLSLIDYEVDIYAGRIFCMQRERRYTHDEMFLRRYKVTRQIY